MNLIAQAIFLAVVTNAPAPVGHIVFNDGNGGKSDAVSLYAERGDCPAGAMRSVYFVARAPAGQNEIPGCYVIKDGFVYMVFADGDQGRVPADMVKPGKRPVAWI
ncbi:MAG: hypothetical protein H0W40_19435 [Methylibium sp.]|uniref:hypothetical protein n=1 Tax=Methylibium sp. TaxID=2067992 RepID=UPI001849C8BD|nr:hypothetical protein [Methylibium sp.]MBA3599517.1 hypothetical protein [Methylibium sp.]